MAYPVTTERRKGQGYIQRTLAAIRAGLQGKSGLRTAVSDWLEDRTEHFTLHDVCKGALQRDMTRMSRDEVIRLTVLLRELGCQRIQKRVAGHPARFWWIPPVSGFWEIIDKD